MLAFTYLLNLCYSSVYLSYLTEFFAITDITMNLIASDQNSQLSELLEGFNCPAILVSIDYEILATNQRYETAFDQLDADKTHRCFEVSHGYKLHCDQAGEDCPLEAAPLNSFHK